MLKGNPDYGLGSRVDALYPFLGHGIFTHDGSSWKHSRELLRHQFARMQYQNLKGINKHVNDLVLLLSESTGIINLQPLFFNFTLSTTMALIFGRSVASLSEDKQEAFGRNFDYASAACAIRLLLAEFYWAYTPSKYNQACSVVKNFASDFVDQALKLRDRDDKDASSRYAFIYDLYDELKDSTLVRDQLRHVLIAGRDTTACLLSWTLWVAFSCQSAHNVDLIPSQFSPREAPIRTSPSA